MEVSFYKYTGQRNVINKSLPEPVTYTGKIYRFDYRKPVLVIRGNVRDFTYCFIPGMDRYYFVDSVQYDGDKATVYLTCDVLTTFSVQIKSATGTVYSTDKPNKYDSDFAPVTDVRPNKVKLDFPVDGLTESGSIVMITIKGNK